ncbi:hypothetical protein G8A07_20330 [Roseateles sp. DAIF2]|uniref:hypothetical protein n=1 Tax=Roseateles sp. DAIF2 TaxID=2714952 RepID=UPI0018A2AD63|nr:hypothetical protein [Roseateles sp. DAIF2]QPF75030.1 hypothetical protein G8A07_20330 [Roseateles sp. DAIF2]
MSGGPTYRQGLADALGFVLGALAGWQLGSWLGFDFIGSTQWQTPQLIGLLFILAGCGLGRWLARKIILR